MRAFLPYFPWLFGLLVLVDLYVGTYGHEALRWFSKPLILISLLLFFVTQGKQLPKRLYWGFALGLLLSLLGDILLLKDAEPGYFIGGLIAFLLAHVAYTYVFSLHWNKKPDTLFWMGIIVLLGYGSLLFSYLQPHLGALQVPVVVYILGILAMATTALNRKKEVVPQSFQWVLAGALFFIASDSILAINKFMAPVAYSHILIMGTYAAAQFCLVKGMLAVTK
ncbi:MAG: lysoplasmalogenase [Flavobacteriaceae bacterium]